MVSAWARHRRVVVPVYTRTRHLRRALCPFFSACPTMATTLALVQVLAGSSGSHMGSGLENSRNVSQLLTALQSLPVTSLSCDCLQSSVKRSLVGGQSEDSGAPAVVLRSNPVCGEPTGGSQWSQLSVTNPFSLPLTGKDTNSAVHCGTPVCRELFWEVHSFQLF